MRLMIDIICACADSERQCRRYNRLSVITRTTYSMHFQYAIHVDGVLHSRVIFILPLQPESMFPPIADYPHWSRVTATSIRNTGALQCPQFSHPDA